jgi:hypothetical protein
MATPPDFTAGQVLAASSMNLIGSWLVKKQTIGTAVSSVTVSDAFTADYTNYRIIVSGGVASTNSDLRLTLGSTVAGYYYALTYSTYTTATALSVRAANAASWAFAGQGTTDTLSMDVNIQTPFETKRSVIRGNYISTATDGAAGIFGGYLADNTSYTALTITPSTGTITGGTIFVYGLRD